MGGPSSRVIALTALLVVALLLAGCVSKKGDTREEVLRSWSRDTPTDSTSEVTFNVREGTDRIRLRISTEPDKQDEPYWPCPPNTPGCDTNSDDSPSGAVTVTLWDARNEQQARIRLNYDSSDTEILPDPAPGRWLAKITYGGYEGPVSMKVTEPQTGGGNFGDDFWDILGIVLTVGLATGGWVIYRRRRGFLTRQLDRIDHTFRDFSEDVTECRHNLLEMKSQLAGMLQRSKLEESQYLILEKRIDQYLEDLDTPGNRHAKDPGDTTEGAAL